MGLWANINFPLWKVKMTKNLQSLGNRVVKAVTKLFSVPDGDEDVGPKAHHSSFNDDQLM